MKLPHPLTLPFTWTLRGHCRVINWLNFNIVVSQEIGGPRKRERDGEQPVGEAIRTHITFTDCLPSYTRRVHVAPKQLQWERQISLIKDRVTNIIIMKKFLKYSKNYQNVTQRHKVSKCCCKNGANRQMLPPTNLQFVKNTIICKAQ